MQLDKFEGADFKYDSFIKFWLKKNPNKAFLVPNLDIFVFSKNFQLDKFDSADFKYYNSFLKILAQKYPNFVSSFFVAKFCNYINSRVLISNTTIFF